MRPRTRVRFPPPPSNARRARPLSRPRAAGFNLRTPPRRFAPLLRRTGPQEVVVSGTVKDLVAGSGFSFTDRGERELKGVPDLWRLYVAEPREGG